jgi:predicted DsbA family dithiol-disulfide isomerase
MKDMKVDIWSDVVCPWCYIGKRRFEAALAKFEHRDEVEVVWHSYELDPRAPRRREGDQAERLARKYGMSLEQARASQDRLTGLAAAEGLDFRFDLAKSGNTFDAHRLLHLAHDRGQQDALKERLLAAYFIEGDAVGETDVLARLAAEAGLDPSEVQAVLDGDKYGDEVRADEEAANELGISGVPFFVVGGKFAVAGAQQADVFLAALERAWDKTHPLVAIQGDNDASCEGDNCAV